MEILSALIAMICIAINDVIFKLVPVGCNHFGNTGLFMSLQSFAAVIVIFGFSVFSGRHINHGILCILYGAILGILSFLTYLLMLLSVRGADASKSVTIYRMNFVISSIAAAIFLGEVLTVKKIISILLLIATVSIYSKPERKNDGLRSAGLKYSIVACFAGAALTIVSKIALVLVGDSNSLMLYRFITVFVLSTAAMFAKKEIMPPTPMLGGLGSISGVILAAAVFFSYMALRTGEVTVVIPIMQLSFVVTAIIMFIFMKEKLTISKGIGMCIAIASILLMV